MLRTMLHRFAALIVLATTVAGQTPAGRVTGTVVDQVNLPIPGVLATIESPMPMAGAHTDATGRFLIDGVPPGTYTLRLQAAGFRPRDVSVDIAEAKETSLGRVTLTVIPPPPCLGEFDTPIFRERKLDGREKTRLSGTASEAGIALRQMEVRLRGPGTSGVVLSASTDEKGRFQFEGIPAGWYELLIPDPGLKLKVRVKNGRGLDVGLRWKNPPPGQLCL